MTFEGYFFHVYIEDEKIVPEEDLTVFLQNWGLVNDWAALYSRGAYTRDFTVFRKYNEVDLQYIRGILPEF